MGNIVALQWPNFSVNLAKVNTTLKSTLSSNYDGLVAYTDSLNVMFKTDASDDDVTALQNYWNGISSATFNPTAQEQIQSSLSASMTFCQGLMLQFMVENVQLGITQSGKAGLMIDYLHDVIHSFLSGSVYEAISQIDGFIADTSDAKANLAPFVTNDRLTTYKNKIQDYLGIPRT